MMVYSLCSALYKKNLFITGLMGFLGTITICINVAMSCSNWANWVSTSRTIVGCASRPIQGAANRTIRRSGCRSIKISTSSSMSPRATDRGNRQPPSRTMWRLWTLRLSDSWTSLRNSGQRSCRQNTTRVKRSIQRFLFNYIQIRSLGQKHQGAEYEHATKCHFD